MPENAVIALQPGASFHERYRVVRRLKAGGMGAVYEVVDERTKSPRALKIMLPSVLADADLRARFALEATVTGNIASDHLVRVSDAGIDEATETPFLVMELLHGEELGRMLARRGPLPPAEVVLYLHQTALALDKTHAANVVHRDLKPDNLFVTYRDDGSPCIKILDFGIAKVIAESVTQTAHMVGTPVYMAPEQIRGGAAIGPQADRFALAHIAYALLAGEPYWHENSKSAPSIFALLTAVMEGMSEAPSARALRRRAVALSPAFDAWMRRALARRQEDRFDSAAALVDALAEALGVAPVATTGARARRAPASPPSRVFDRSQQPTPVAMARGAAPSRSRSMLPAALGTVVLAAALGAGVHLAARWRGAGSPLSPKPQAERPLAASPAEPSPPTLPAPPLTSASGAPGAPEAAASAPGPTATATAAAPTKAPPSGKSAPGRSTSPKAPSEQPQAPTPTRITSPL
jgi:serine/threonine protein kinase